MDRPMCRHCQVGHGNRPRGLCYRCYEDLSIRYQYWATSKFTPKHLLDGDDFVHLEREQSDSPLPTTPTQTLVGSPAREEVLRERAKRGEALHHPDDSRECVRWFDRRLAHELFDVVPVATLLRDE